MKTKCFKYPGKTQECQKGMCNYCICLVIFNILTNSIMYNYLRVRDLGLAEIPHRVHEGNSPMKQVGLALGSE